MRSRRELLFLIIRPKEENQVVSCNLTFLSIPARKSIIKGTSWWRGEDEGIIVRLMLVLLAVKTISPR